MLEREVGMGGEFRQIFLWVPKVHICLRSCVDERLPSVPVIDPTTGDETVTWWVDYSF